MIHCPRAGLCLVLPWIPSPENIVCGEICLVIVCIVIINSQWLENTYSSLGTLNICSFQFNPHKPPYGGNTIIIPILQMRKLNLTETPWPTQGYIANIWLSQDLNVMCLTSDTIFLAPMLCYLSFCQVNSTRAGHILGWSRSIPRWYDLRTVKIFCQVNLSTLDFKGGFICSLTEMCNIPEKQTAKASEPVHLLIYPFPITELRLLYGAFAMRQP